MRCIVSLTALLTLIACADTPAPPPPPPASGTWVPPFDWVLAAPSRAPFAAARPDDTPCDPSAHGPEALGGVWVYSIETEACPWITLSQPTALPARGGEHVHVASWHFELIAPEPAMGHVRFATDQGVLITTDVPIPSPGGLLILEHTLEIDIPEGTELTFHLDNHGANSWHLVDVQRNPE